MAKKYKYQGYPGNLCNHPDCYYRRVFNSGFSYCGYAYETNELRKCPADNCNKYISKKEAGKDGHRILRGTTLW